MGVQEVGVVLRRRNQEVDGDGAKSVQLTPVKEVEGRRGKWGRGCQTKELEPSSVVSGSLPKGGSSME